MTIKFNSADKNLLVQRGKLEDEKARKFIRDALGVTGKKVEATRHTILSGPPGVGKSYGTIDECNKANVDYITVEPGTTDITLATMLAYAVYWTCVKQDKELVVILDDADDVVFGEYKTLNKWKLAFADINPELGIVPQYAHRVSMNNTKNNFEKAGNIRMLEALQYWESDGEMGIGIDMDKVRFVILCNLDFERPKAFRSAKIQSAIEPILDRFAYKRISLTDDDQWGWLAYTLINTQPFDTNHLSDDQKKTLLDWMKSNWSNLRSKSYRTVKKLAADMINHPNDYEDQWNEKLKGH